MATQLETVITVPHATCPPDPRGHLCDHAAPAVGRELYRALPGSLLIESEIHRDPEQIAADGKPGSDQNRPWARTDTVFHKRLRAALDRRPELLLDVHSFPEGVFEGLEVVVLDPDRGRDRTSRELVRALVSEGVLAKIWPASTVNAIVVDARALGIDAVLIEFNEGMSAGRRRRAISATSAWANARTDSIQLL